MLDIEVIKRRLLIKYPLFGSIVANSEFIDSDLVDTAGTDGNKIYYNKKFIEGLEKDEATFVFAHEVCHIAFDHILRSEGKDSYLWNIATDSVINALLSSDGLPIIDGAVDIPEAINFNAEEMYQKLLEEKKQAGMTDKESLSDESNNHSNNETNKNGDSYNKKSSNLNGNKSLDQSNKNREGNQENNSVSDTDSEEDRDVGHDTHNMWAKAVEENKQNEVNDQVNDDTNNGVDKKILEKENKKAEVKNRATKLGEKETFKQNKITRKKQLEELQKSLAKQASGSGDNSNGDTRNISDIGVAKALIDWRRLLKEACKLDVDWSYKNAFIDEGVVNPNLEELPFRETEIVLDTSGSIDEILLKNFLRECKNIIKTSKVKVGCFDTKFYGFKEIRNVYDIDKMEFKGGGGTDFDVAVNAFTKRVENKIIFTDGYASMPSKQMDAIWVVFGNNKINPKGGRVIYINKEQLAKLNRFNNSR